MHDLLVDVISVLIVLGIMVIVHEFGHFLAAKLCGVRVEQFSVGFPPRLFGIKIGETDYCVSAIPLGGYVKMTGETLPGENLSSLQAADGETIAQLAQDPGALTSHPRWQRMIIGAAGPVANFILALLLMTGYYMLHNEVFTYVDQPVTADWIVPGSPAAVAGLQPGDRIVSFDGKQDPTVQQLYVAEVKNLNQPVSVVVDRSGQRVPLTLQVTDPSKGKDFNPDTVGILPVRQTAPVKVAAVGAGTPAGNAGIQKGDLFLALDGHPFHSTESVVSYLQSGKGKPVNIELSRDGKTSNLVVTPVLADDPKQGKAWRLGFNGTPPPTRVEQLPIGEAVKASAKFNRENSLDILDVVKRLFQRKMSMGSLSGPIGIAQQTGMAWDSGNIGLMIQLMTVISLNLGVLNLLPFPILDGGMILFLIIESIIRRDVPMAAKERIYQVAFVLILVFFAFVIFNDISKLSYFNHAKP
jgi:regulator of sigma E protease